MLTQQTNFQLNTATYIPVAHGLRTRGCTAIGQPQYQEDDARTGNSQENGFFSESAFMAETLYRSADGDYRMKETSKRGRRLSPDRQNLRKRRNLAENDLMEAQNQEEYVKEGQNTCTVQGCLGKCYSLEDEACSESTAFSEPIKNLEDENSLDQSRKEEGLVSRNNSSSFDEVSAEDNVVLFTICLENGPNHFETITIYKDESDYESFLNEICERHNMFDKASLCFKINLMNMISQCHPNPESVQPYLNKLLEMNYSLVMSEAMQSEQKDEVSPSYDVSLYDGDVEDFDDSDEDLLF